MFKQALLMDPHPGGAPSSPLCTPGAPLQGLHTGLCHPTSLSARRGPSRLPSLTCHVSAPPSTTCLGNSPGSPPVPAGPRYLHPPPPPPCAMTLPSLLPREGGSCAQACVQVSGPLPSSAPSLPHPTCCDFSSLKTVAPLSWVATPFPCCPLQKLLGVCRLCLLEFLPGLPTSPNLPVKVSPGHCPT